MAALAPVVESAESLLREQVVIPMPEAPATADVRDPDDAWVLASALSGKADILVTGDRNLLALQSDAPLAILTPREWWDRLRN
jgi:putative PIN family toxin of toxin-antitoxin system